MQRVESKDSNPLNALESFCDEVMHSPLSPSAKQDAINNLQTFLYIQKNLPSIQAATDDWIQANKAGDRNQASNKYFSNERDKKNGVLRTPDGFSFHINYYKNGQDAVKAFERQAEQLATMLQTLQGDDRLLFASKFEWVDDNSPGCNEKRTERAFLWAHRRIEAIHNRSPRTLEDIIAICYIKNNNSHLNLQTLVLDYCKANNIETAVDFDNQAKPLTPEIIADAVELVYPKEEVAIASAPLQYDDYLKLAEIKTGGSGMIQHWFKDEMKAKEFLAWIKNIKPPLPDGINNASIKPEKNKENNQDYYVVRLTPAQREVLSKKTEQKLEQKEEKKQEKKLEQKQKQNQPVKQKEHSAEVKSQIGELLGNYYPHSVMNSSLIPYLNEWPEDQMAQILSARTPNGRTLLAQIIHIASHNTFERFIKNKKVSSEAISQALAASGNDNLLHYAVSNLSSDGFKMLVVKASEDAVNRALIAKDFDDNTLFHLAAEKQSSAAFKALLQKASVEVINQALMVKNKSKDTAFYIAADHQPSDGFKALLQKASSDTINQALVMQSRSSSNTALHIAAHKQSSDAFKALLQKASEAVINQALVMQNANNNTVLHIAAFHQSSDGFQALLQNASDAAINQALMMKGTGNDTALHFAASNQSADGFKALLQKASDAAINQALVVKNDFNDTALHWAALKQLPDGFQALLQKASDAAINQACSYIANDNKSVLDHAISYQPPTLIANMLSRVDDVALKIMLRYPQTPASIISVIANYIAHENTWQVSPLVDRLFNTIGVPLVKVCLRQWLSGKEFPPSVMKAAMPMLEEAIRQEPHNKELLGLKSSWTAPLKQDEIGEGKLEQKEPERIQITLQSGEILPCDKLNDAEQRALAEKIWKAGLSSGTDYHILNKVFPATSSLGQVIAELRRADFLYTGCKLGFEYPAAIELKSDQVIQTGNAFIKIVKEENFPDFKNQMKNYTYRAGLREKVDKRKKTHKAVLYEGEEKEIKNANIIEYKYHDPKTKNKVYTHTKKQAVSLLSPELNTSVFGEHDPSRPLVGLLFDKDKTKIKAMFLRDTGTFKRGWVTSSKEQAEAYLDKHKDRIVTDFKEYQQKVKENPQALNEALVKLSRESMMGIVMVTDTPQAREMARKYQKEIYDEMKIDLPIVFYDRALRQMRPYTKSAQLSDILGVSSLKFKNDCLTYFKNYKASIPKFEVKEAKLAKPKMGFFDKLMGKSPPPPPDVLQSAADKMAALLEGNQEQSFRNEELQALKSSPFKEYTKKLEEYNLLPQSYIARKKLGGL